MYTCTPARVAHLDIYLPVREEQIEETVNKYESGIKIFHQIILAHHLISLKSNSLLTIIFFF